MRCSYRSTWDGAQCLLDAGHTDVHSPGWPGCDTRRPIPRPPRVLDRLESARARGLGGCAAMLLLLFGSIVVALLWLGIWRFGVIIIHWLAAEGGTK